MLGQCYFIAGALGVNRGVLTLVVVAGEDCRVSLCVIIARLGALVWLTCLCLQVESLMSKLFLALRLELRSLCHKCMPASTVVASLDDGSTHDVLIREAIKRAQRGGTHQIGVESRVWRQDRPVDFMETTCLSKVGFGRRQAVITS